MLEIKTKEKIFLQVITRVQTSIADVLWILGYEIGYM